MEASGELVFAATGWLLLFGYGCTCTSDFKLRRAHLSRENGAGIAAAFFKILLMIFFKNPPFV